MIKIENGIISTYIEQDPPRAYELVICRENGTIAYGIDIHGRTYYFNGEKLVQAQTQEELMEALTVGLEILRSYTNQPHS